MDPRDLLIANLDVVERVIAFTCRRHRLDEADAEDFASTVKLKVVENDYAIIRRFQGRSSFATFMAVVVHRMLLDYRVHLWGKWHPSAEATRLGEVAVDLEASLYRDGRTLEGALPILLARHPGATAESVRALASRLPERGPKRRLVQLDEAASVAASSQEPDTDRERISARVSDLVRSFLERLVPEDRLVLQLRFDAGMTVAQIARSLHLDQKQLYRRMEKQLRAMRAELEAAGVAAGEVATLIGDRGVVLDFRLANGEARPSTRGEETGKPGKEEATR